MNIERPAEEGLRAAHSATAGGVTPAIPWAQRLPGVFFALLFVVASSLVLTIRVAPSDRIALQPDDVSPLDVRAPRDHYYVSELLTEEARQSASAMVADVYDQPQTAIRQQQVARAREVLDFIASVRADSYASVDDQVDWILAIPDMTLTTQDAANLLNLSDESWLRVAAEVPLVVNRAMRDEIRDHQLSAARRQVDTLIGLQVRLTDAEVEAASALSKGLLQANTFYNAEKTDAARKAAREGVEPMAISFAEGETIVRAGDIVDALDVEALEQMDLYQAAWDWWEAAGAILFVLILSLLIWVYLFLFVPQYWKARRWPPLLTLLLIAYVFLAKLMLPLHAVLPYYFPIAALSMILASLFDLHTATLITICLSLIAGYLTGGSPEIMTYTAAGALIGAYTLGRGERIGSFVRAGALVALTNILVLAAFRLPEHSLDLVGTLELAGSAIANGVLATSLTLLGFFLLGALFGVTTSLQLIELSRPTHPLLRELILRAPGTYHHTILISNMAERAATNIGADPFLARVGSFYHDIGKTVRPHFFIENQAGENNPFDQLDPYTSTKIVMSHVRDGLDLAEKHRLPERVRAFIPEHHGTLKVGFFYQKAVEQAGEDAEVREADFRYPGPKPQSRETAIVMLADGCEAAVRAKRPESEEKLEAIVRGIINQRLTEGQMSECEVTLRDLDGIAKAFVDVLRGLRHPRIDYPEPPESIAPVAEPADVPA
jgi:putative nucleotidyltransferase with HDIG domain